MLTRQNMQRKRPVQQRHLNEGVMYIHQFLDGYGRPTHRTYVSTVIRGIYEQAKVLGEKGNPKSLRKLYLSTRAGIESNVALLVEQAMERIMEQEQFFIGWEEI